MTIETMRETSAQPFARMTQGRTGHVDLFDREGAIRQQGHDGPFDLHKPAVDEITSSDRGDAERRKEAGCDGGAINQLAAGRRFKHKGPAIVSFEPVEEVGLLPPLFQQSR